VWIDTVTKKAIAVHIQNANHLGSYVKIPIKIAWIWIFKQFKT